MSDVARIGNYKITLRENECQVSRGNKTPQSLGTAAFTGLEKTSNLFQLSNLGDKTCKLIGATVGNSQGLKEMGSLFQGGLTMSAALFAPHTVINIGKTFESLKKAYAELKEWPEFFVRRLIAFVRSAGEGISTSGYAIAPFIKTIEKTGEISGKIFNLAKHSKFVSDSCNLIESSQDFWTSRSLSANAETSEIVMNEVKENLQETMRLNLLKVTKSICSIAGYILGMGVISAGIASTPAYAVGVASISMVGSILGIGISLYSTQTKYKQINFYDTKSVVYIPSRLEKESSESFSSEIA